VEDDPRIVVRSEHVGRWDWEVQVPELGTSVFIMPVSFVKNGDERLVVLNRIAKSVVEAPRGQHATHVFTYRGKPITRLLTKAWQRARQAAGLPQVRVHDLTHTFARRLRAAGASLQDWRDVLGHTALRGSRRSIPLLNSPTHRGSEPCV
jgi:integrase